MNESIVSVIAHPGHDIQQTVASSSSWFVIGALFAIVAMAALTAYLSRREP